MEKSKVGGFIEWLREEYSFQQKIPLLAYFIKNSPLSLFFLKSPFEANFKSILGLFMSLFALFRAYWAFLKTSWTLGNL